MTDQQTKPRAVKRILWVDDEPEISFFHRKYLERASDGCFQITPALDAADAINMIRREPWDLVILDLILPVKPSAPARPEPGIQLLRWIRTEGPNPEVPVVAVSGYRKQQLDEELEALGARLLPKPVDPDDINRELHRLLGLAGQG